MSLVSVIISAYNSSNFIEETLESIFMQSWSELELIITDDHSTDDTVDKSFGWIKRRGHRFSRVEILTSDVNTGVSANANRGMKAASGNWIKFIGADDTLKKDCIRDNMEWVTLNPEIKVLLSCVEIYQDTISPANLVGLVPNEKQEHGWLLEPDRSACSQYKMLLISDRINNSPSMFIERAALMSVGGFDENYRLLEDYPLWLNLTRRGVKIHFMNKTTVNYRRHSGAIKNKTAKSIISSNYFAQEEFRKVYTYPYLPLDIKWAQRYKWYSSRIFRIESFNRDRVLNKALFKLLTVWLNPFAYLFFVKKLIYPALRDDEFYL